MPSEVELVRDFRHHAQNPLRSRTNAQSGDQSGAQRKRSRLPKSRISIETGQNNGWAVLSIKDTGCGMSADFLKRNPSSAFPDNQKNGFGIGMFQSKMIV